jgi:hypothetical protein
MRTKKVKYLMENGLSSKFLINLTDKQVDVLFSRYIGEQTQPIVRTKTVKQIEVPTGSETSVGGVSVANKAGKTVVTTTAEGEMTEDADLDDSAEKESGFDPYAGNTVANDDGPSSNDGYNKGADGFDILESKKKKSKYNPWAICTSQMGSEFKTTERSQWSPKQKAKYERCVKDVKQSIKEGRDPYETLLENFVLRMVNKHIRPGVTKQDIIDAINENMQLVSFKKLDKPVGKSYSYKKSSPMEQAEPAVKPRTAPPKTKPGVKPNRPNPYQPPKESPKEKPKAQDYKSMFISALNQLLGK